MSKCSGPQEGRWLQVVGLTVLLGAALSNQAFSCPLSFVFPSLNGAPHELFLKFQPHLLPQPAYVVPSGRSQPAPIALQQRRFDERKTRDHKHSVSHLTTPLIPHSLLIRRPELSTASSLYPDTQFQFLVPRLPVPVRQLIHPRALLPFLVGEERERLDRLESNED